jgi:hypothetical protein
MEEVMDRIKDRVVTGSQVDRRMEAGMDGSRTGISGVSLVTR